MAMPQGQESVVDINLVTAIPQPDFWPSMVMVEPLIAAVAQEVEDMQYLPGYRLNFRLVDNLCSPQEAVAQLTRELSQPPAKHGYISGDCSDCCISENNALQYYNLLQISPACTLDDLSNPDRYPYFLRHKPSAQFVNSALFPLLRLLNWWRFSLVSDAGTSSIQQKLVQRFRGAVSQPGPDDWMLVMDLELNAQSAADAVALNASAIARQLILSDSRVVILLVYSWDVSAVLLLETLPAFLGFEAPHIAWVTAATGTTLDFSPAGIVWLNSALRAGGRPTCTQGMLLEASFGWLQIKWAPMKDSPALHGLSGRPLADVRRDYYQECGAFGNNTGACFDLAGYYYDAAWEWAWLLRKFLIDAGRPLDELVTSAGRSQLFETGLTANFLGLTGRVRHFNSVSPTTSPPSIGDRLGDVALMQVQSAGAMTLVGLWDWDTEGSNGTLVISQDLLWSLAEPRQRTRCNGTCDIAGSFVPPCWNASCAPGHVYSYQQGCTACPPGTAAGVGATKCKTCAVGTVALAGQGSCSPCAAGSYQSELGMSFCIPCPPGSTSTPGASACLPCHRGSYKEAPGAGNCLACPTSFTTEEQGAASLAACGCRAGTYLQADNVTCTPCAEGMQCPLFNMRAPEQAGGYFVDARPPHNVWRCTGDAACPGGPAGACGSNRLVRPSCTRCLPGFAVTEGKCSPCEQGSVAGIAVGLVFGVFLLLLLFHVAINFPVLQTSFRSFLGTCLISMAVIALLVLKSFGTTSKVFPQPLQAFFQSLDVLVLRLSVLRLACVTQSPSLWSSYLLKLSVMPGCCLLLAIAFALGSCSPWLQQRLCLNLPSYLNSCGALFSTFFISVSVISFEPFRCEAQPTGQLVLALDHSVPCWQGGEHGSLVSLGVAAILLYLVLFLSLSGLLVWDRERFVRRWGHSFVAATRFLGGRFRPDRGSFGLWLSCRHVLVSLLPVVVPNSHGLLVQLQFAVMMAWLVGVVYKKPWRFEVLDKADVGATLFLAFVLLQLALLPSVSPSHPEALAWVLAVECCLLLALLAAMGLLALLLSQVQQKSYQLFLSHCKQEAGLLCRQLKLMLQHKSTAKVFLDVDNLSNLDQIEGVISSSLETLVVVVTKEVFKRFWCMVELVNAVRHAVPLVLVVVDPIAEAQLGTNFVQSHIDHWTEAQLVDFKDLSIGPRDLEEALGRLATAPVVHLPVSGSEAEQEAGLKALMELGKCPPRSHRCARAFDENLDALAQVVVAFDVNDAEQLCQARILSLLLQEREVKCEIAGGGAGELPRGTVFVVLLSAKLHRATAAIAAAVAAEQAGRPLLTLAMAGYSRPGAGFWEELVAGKAFSEEELAQMQAVCPAATAETVLGAITQIYDALAMTWNPAASEEVMMTEFERIFKRMCVLAEQDHKGVPPMKSRRFSLGLRPETPAPVVSL